MSGPRRIGSKDHRGPVLDGTEIGERKRHEDEIPGTVSLHARPARRRWYLRVRLGRQHPGRRHHLNFGARVVAPAPSVVIARGVPVYFYGSGYYRPWGVGPAVRQARILAALPERSFRPAVLRPLSHDNLRGRGQPKDAAVR